MPSFQGPFAHNRAASLPVYLTKLDQEKQRFLDQSPSRRDLSPQGFFSRLRLLKWRSVLLIGLVSVSLFIYTFSSDISATTQVYNYFNSPEETPLHVLSYAPKANLEVCRSILTGAALNYPTPHLVTFGRENVDDPARISGVVEWLDGFDPEQNDDLVLIVDGQKTWFQLHPHLLVERYRAANELAQRRISKSLGRAMEEEKIVQTVIFGAGKDFGTGANDDLACFPLPSTPIGKTIRGSTAATAFNFDSIPKKSSIRPRYLDSGFVIGPVRDVRVIFQRAQEKVLTEHQGSLDAIMNKLFWEQELQRQLLREQHLGPWDAYKERLAAFFGWKPCGRRLAEHTTKRLAARPGSNPHELGMGLDYFSTLTYSQKDARFVTHGKLGTWAADTKDLSCKSKVAKSLSRDLRYSTPPHPRPNFQTLMPEQWQDVSLYTDMCSNAVPAVIQHAKDTLEWTKHWVQPRAQELLVQQQKWADEGEVTYVQALEDPEQAVKEHSRSLKVNTGGAITPPLPGGNPGVLQWHDLCGGEQMQELLFGKAES